MRPASRTASSARSTSSAPSIGAAAVSSVAAASLVGDTLTSGFADGFVLAAVAIGSALVAVRADPEASGRAGGVDPRTERDSDRGESEAGLWQSLAPAWLEIGEVAPG